MTLNHIALILISIAVLTGALSRQNDRDRIADLDRRVFGEVQQ